MALGIQMGFVHRHITKVEAMRIKYAIIGGGVAGLCAAIRLAELGEEPLLIEGGTYPAHKVCGEFLSPESLQILHHWNIHPFSIGKVTLRTTKRALTFDFPFPAGGLSHMKLGPALAAYATKCGGQVKTNTRVDSFHPKQKANTFHHIQLSSGESIEASHVIIATGRIPNYAGVPPQLAYMGFKAHYENIASEGHLDMYAYPGAYLGVAPIEENKYNVACLACIEKVKSFNSPKDFINDLISQNSHLRSCLSQGKNLFDNWMITSLPAFGIKKTPDWLDAYFIGDSAVTIPPACGNGLSMALLGGCLAAEYSFEQKALEFKKIWTKRCSSQVYWATLLHKLMLNPSYANPLINLSSNFPYLAKKIFQLTRQPLKQ